MINKTFRQFTGVSGILIVIFTLQSCGLFKYTSEYRKMRRDAYDLYYTYENYEKSLKYFTKLDSMSEGKDWKVRYHRALSYLQSDVDKPAALPLLLDKTVAKKMTKKKRKKDYYYWLGRAYHYANKFDSAIYWYDQFLAIAGENTKRANEVKLLKQQAETGKRLTANPKSIKIENLGSAINTPYHEYAPVLTPDETILMFTSRRPGNIGGLRSRDGKPDRFGGIWFEDVYVAIKTEDNWLEAQNVGAPVNTPDHDATVTLSPDGKIMYFYRSDGKKWGDIYKSVQSGYTWSEPQKLGPPINSEYWEPSMTMTPDSQIIIFSSNRPGGYGGLDLYMSRRLPDGTWAKPVNLGPKVNTPYDEDAPFIHVDGKTLYFSSNGPNSMGGFDVFVTKMTGDNEWTDPVNLGYPINTTDDDIFFVLSPDGRRGYMASVRPEGLGGQDLYVIYMPKEKDILPTAMVLVLADVIDAQSKQPISNAKIKALYRDSILGVFTADSRGSYVLIVPQGVNLVYAVEAEGYPTLWDTIAFVANQQGLIKHTFELRKEKMVDKWEQLREFMPIVYFDFNRAVVKKSEQPKIDSVISIMKQYPEGHLRVIGHTDAKGTLQYNYKLGLRRAEAVADLLVKKGFPKDKINIESYGEVLPQKVNVLIDGRDNPEGRALNRRVEFIPYPQGAEIKPLADPLKIPNVIRYKAFVDTLSADAFTVKIYSGNRKLPLAYLIGMHPVIMKYEGGTYTYYSGVFSTQESAQKHSVKLKEMGVSEPEVTIIKSKRVKISDKESASGSKPQIE
ncbi:MAG: OmpA family protein [Chlorobi bacterium]|nr:OmpA family protein [Chlorobiota bacterium]